jgi:predicted protein tyrosine phosphatase
MFPMSIMAEYEVKKAVQDEPDWALLSIRSPDNPNPFDVLSRGPRLNLQFDDLTRKPTKPLGSSVPEVWHARQIIEFAQGLKADPPGGLHVHCHAGISRSSAACLGVAMVLEGNARQALASVKSAVDTTFARGWRDDTSILPNRRLVALVDRELGCGGELLREMLQVYCKHHPVEILVQAAMLDIEEG